jgi:hypothetical protein
MLRVAHCEAGCKTTGLDEVKPVNGLGIAAPAPSRNVETKGRVRESLCEKPASVVRDRNI